MSQAHARGDEFEVRWYEDNPDHPISVVAQVVENTDYQEHPGQGQDYFDIDLKETWEMGQACELNEPHEYGAPLESFEILNYPLGVPSSGSPRSTEHQETAMNDVHSAKGEAAKTVGDDAVDYWGEADPGLMEIFNGSWDRGFDMMAPKK